ncbi:hypothetical protein H180DRAFT_05699 [Streptomyces sp. WMMB 322]|nr:hypothetical protein H180DRAFT_05699 [Streptomyces sp. WMMB 322]
MNTNQNVSTAVRASAGAAVTVTAVCRTGESEAPE